MILKKVLDLVTISTAIQGETPRNIKLEEGRVIDSYYDERFLKL